ncbi:MAG: 4-hydroxy-tetrahydrodipicolinate synthase [Bacteroidetes bacterium]|nr:4-hydroxy-tetrahydrodipicolinate synthase [Bacteroidota bacterium]MBL6963247.1 4-hydroxy-tetrahydrodipicolinate synthase [Bacteroidota bacterium]
MIFKGLGVAVITPFTPSLEVDYDAFKRIIINLIDQGVDYLVLMGTTAESPTLSSLEKRKIIDTAIEINKDRLPLVVGIGGNNTMQLVKEISAFDFTSLHGILSVSPYYNKPSQEGIYQHYKILSESTDMPIILYNVPGRTGSNLLAETTLRLAHDFKNIAAIKEASGDLPQIMQIIQSKPEDFLVISGDDLLTLPQMALGMDGVISVIGNAMPAEFADMLKLALTDPLKASSIHYKLLKFIHLIFAEGNPAGIKALLNHMKLCEPHVRPPLVQASQSLVDRIKDELLNFNS